MRKYSKEDLFKMPAVDVYKLVLKGDEVKIFPAGFWQRPEALENAKECTIFLIETILQLSEEDVKKQLSQKLFNNNKLCGMLHTCFNGSPYEAINNAYKDKYKPWEFNIVPTGFWTKERAVEATRWLFEQKLNLTDDEIKEKLERKLFMNNGLDGMLLTCFNGSTYKAIEAAYPGKFREWEFNQVPQGFWTFEKGLEATKWLFEEKLNLKTEEEVRENLSYTIFAENGLSNMLNTCFNNSQYEAMNALYPGKYKEWKLVRAPKGFWQDKENGIRALRWLIEEALSSACNFNNFNKK